jgi:6-phosphofructokinase
LRACPKTIDNDLSATELTFGFDTALHTVSGAIAKIHTTASSHHRVMVVEVMGRDCGRIALAGGISGGAHIILIPEIPFTIKSGCDFIALRESRGGRFTIVVVAEGIRLPPELKQMARGWSVGNTIGDAIGLFANIVRQHCSPTRKCGSACWGTFSAVDRHRRTTGCWRRASGWCGQLAPSGSDSGTSLVVGT